MWCKLINRSGVARFSNYVIRWLAPVVWVMGGTLMFAQVPPFNSGSSGADGALTFTTPGTYLFDPSTVPNHKAGDSIFNFTTITIATGVTLRLDSRLIAGPVYWLTTGDVTIGGILDLSGQNGHSSTANRVDRGFSVAGAGGFGGGPGGGGTGSNQVQPEPGSGPGGGKAPACDGAGLPGVFSGSEYLIPLVGGSGGSGGCTGAIAFECGGGAGGGAILIASSTTINLTGSIYAYGGANTGCSNHYAGGGSGGAIRLVANTANIGGVIAAQGQNGGGYGFARFEAFNLYVHGEINANSTQSTPIQVVLPQGGASTVQVTSVAGMPITTNPFTFPDVTIGTSSPVPVVIQGQNVPAGAVPMLIITSETGKDQTITAPALQPVSGNPQQTTSTVNIAYPPGGSKGLIRLTWTN